MKVIIVGGGIAGPVAALFLKQAGIHVEVYEARSESESYTGWFLNLAGNGMEILNTLGIDDLISQKGSPVPRMMMWSGKGKQLGEVRNGARDGLVESVLIRRSDLQQSLHAALVAQDIPLYFHKRLSSITVEGQQRVTVTFDDGTQASGDLLIGADGTHSRVRTLINPGAPKPSYTQLISTGGFTSNVNLAPTTRTQHFIFGKKAFFGYHVRSSGEVYWFNNYKQEHEPGRNELAQTTSEEWKQYLLEMHKDDMPLINQIIESTTEGIGAFAIYDIASQPVWHEGPVVLIGDAIHAVSPSSGQGASQAMEDAAMLAKCLRDMPTVEAALNTYETIRRQRVERVVKWGRSIGGAKLISNPIAVWLRDLMMPLFLKLFNNPKAQDWIYAYDIDWDQSATQSMS